MVLKPTEYNHDEEAITLYYLKLKVISASNLRKADMMGKSDPYVEVFVNEYIKRT